MKRPRLKVPDSRTALRRWTRRFRRLAVLGRFDPGHDRFTQWDPCPICNGDVRGFSSRLEASQRELVDPLVYAGQKGDHLMALLWWYWVAMRIVRREEENARALRGAARVRAHRARKRGTVRSFKVFTVASPLFTGKIAVRQAGDFEAEVAPSESVVQRRVRRVPPPPVRQHGRPASPEKPTLLVPLVAATLLHDWFPRRPSAGRFTYLSWSLITDVLRTFTPPKVSFGFGDPASLQRKVRAYRNDPSLGQRVSSLRSKVIPAILRAFGSR